MISFLPIDSSIPDDTSTPITPSILITSLIFNEFKPPAIIIGDIFFNFSIIFQSNFIPVPPFCSVFIIVVSNIIAIALFFHS
jgi:hypothetical protein